MSDTVADEDPVPGHPELLVLIKDSPEAQRLIVTWERAWVEYHELDYSGSILRPDFQPDDEFTVAWARLADTDPEFVVRFSPVLFVNGLLEPEGVTPKWVIGPIRALMMDAMPG